MFLTRIKRFFIKLLATMTILVLVIQIPMINTSVTQGIINLFLPKGMSIHLSRLEGVFPFDLKTSKIKFKDMTAREGKVWLQIDNFHFTWRAVDFLYGNFHIENLSADSVTINTIPLHLITFDDDPIYLPYANIDTLTIKSLHAPLIYPGVVTAKGNLKSDFQDNHRVALNFYAPNSQELPALISIDYTQQGADYTLQAVSQQDVHSFHSLSPSVFDQISMGKVDLTLNLSGRSDFLELGGSLEASLTDLMSTIPAFQTLVGSSASTKILVMTKKTNDTKEIIVNDGILKTDKGLLVTLDYQRTQHKSGKDHELTAKIHIPNSTEIVKNFAQSLPFSGPLTIKTHYEYKASGNQTGSLSLEHIKWSSSLITPLKLNFVASPQEIDFSVVGGLPKLLDAQLKGTLKKEGNIFNGPLSCSMISPYLNLNVEAVLSHEALFPWDRTTMNIPPTFVFHNITLGKTSRSLISHTKDITLHGTALGFSKGVTIPSAQLNLFDGVVSVKDFHVGLTPTGELKFNNLSAQSLVAFMDVLVGDGNFLKDKSVQGILNGGIQFTGDSSSSSSYHATFSLDDFCITNELQKTSPLITVNLEANHSGESLEWLGTLIDKKESSLKWQGKAKTNHLIPIFGDPIDYSLTGILNISALKSFMPGSDKYGGTIDVHLRGEGTFAADPFANLTGNIKTTNGSYENGPFGTVIKDISLFGNVKGSVFLLNNMTAKDLSRGSIEGSGTIDFKHLLQPLLNINLKLQKFLISNTDESTIMSSGNITIVRKSFSDPIIIGGKVSVDGAMITLENASADPKTIRLYRHEEELENKMDRLINASSKDFKSQLDLDVRIPKNLFIDGFGLKSEWSGGLRLKGPVNCPDIQGKIDSISGRLDIANKHLALEKSEISFTKGIDEKGGAEIVPLLNIRTSKIVGEYTAYLIISGSAYDPLLTFRSEPALSKEAVISLILFEKNLQNVTAAQTLQLATALASLNNKSFTGSAFNTLTSILGVDEISIAESDKKDKQDDIGDDSGGAYSLRVGKQLNDRIYLGIDQGIRETNETKAHLKIDVTKNTKIDIETGTEDSSIGYNWEMRY